MPMSEQEKLQTQKDFMSDIIKSVVGDVSEMKVLDDDQYNYLYKLCMMDMLNGLQGDMFTDDIISRLVSEGAYRQITMIYLYCNWRVWATYQQNEEWARKYQDVCDNIDKLVFDAWKNDKSKIDYFISETD